MLQGETAQEAVQLNIESLWSGGPFQDPVSSQAHGPLLSYTAARLLVARGLTASLRQSYNGGNKLPSDQSTVAEQMQTIRQTIFQSDSGTIDSRFIDYVKARRLILTPWLRHRANDHRCGRLW